MTVNTSSLCYEAYTQSKISCHVRVFNVRSIRLFYIPWWDETSFDTIYCSATKYFQSWLCWTVFYRWWYVIWCYHFHKSTYLLPSILQGMFVNVFFLKMKIFVPFSFSAQPHTYVSSVMCICHQCVDIIVLGQ